MMLHLTRDEADMLTADGRGVLFRPSECPDCHGPPTFGCIIGPPAEFVEAAAPCETCGGSGVADEGDDQFPALDCDCIDGKRRIAVTVPCETCVPHRPGSTVIDDCPDCGLRSLVTVAHVVVTWGPERVHLDDGDIWIAADVTLPPDVDPESLVGQYAIGIEVVE